MKNSYALIRKETIAFSITYKTSFTYSSLILGLRSEVGGDHYLENCTREDYKRMNEKK